MLVKPISFRAVTGSLGACSLFLLLAGQAHAQNTIGGDTFNPGQADFPQSGSEVGRGPAFQFSDEFYRANGIDPVELRNQESGATAPSRFGAFYRGQGDVGTAAGTALDARFINDTRITIHNMGYNAAGETLFYPDPPAFFFESGFLDEETRDLTNKSFVFIFPRTVEQANPVAGCDGNPLPNDLLSPAPCNRRQDNINVLEVQTDSGTVRSVFADKDSAWADVCDDVVWLDPDGRVFTWVSESGGWRQVWVIDRDGSEPFCLTPQAQDVISVLKVDTANDALWFLASPENATQRYLYRQGFSGGDPQRVTPEDQPGTHAYQISEDGKFAIHRWSSRTQVPQVELVRLPNHTPVESFPTVRNERLAQRVAELPPVKEEFFEVALSDGTVLDGWMMYPPNFDPEEKKWPVIMHVYGEPAGTTVNDSWGSASQLWHRMLAQEGYVVASVDNRGTPAPKGRAWRKSVYGSVGVLASEDQAEAVRREAVSSCM